jgi:hypothetical protein
LIGGSNSNVGGLAGGDDSVRVYSPANFNPDTPKVSLLERGIKSAKQIPLSVLLSSTIGQGTSGILVMVLRVIGSSGASTVGSAQTGYTAKLLLDVSIML